MKPETTETLRQAQGDNRANIIRTRIASALFTGDAPVRFMWMPAGIHTVHAVHDSGKPIEITVAVTKDDLDRIRSGKIVFNEPLTIGEARKSAAWGSDERMVL